MHRVEAGENLAAIAHRFNASAKLIASANNLSGGEPAMGDRLLIPAAYHEPAAPVRPTHHAGRTSQPTSPRARPALRTQPWPP